MSVSLPVTKPLPVKSRDARTRLYQTTCKICGCGIYTGQLSHWSRKPMGMVHDECAGAAS